MTRARRETVHPDQPGFYHCISRCVRRAYLCGNDLETGRNFNHRRDWIESRIEHLSTVFCIDIYAYAIMSNHYHLVLRTDPKRVRMLSDRQICRRWKQMYQLNPEGPSKDETTTASREQITIWRERLASLSWFMKALNEPIARAANSEDECKGHFWESRFKSIPLLDEKAVVACMAYVDLNPIRSGEVSRIDKSAYTSVKRRLLTHSISPATQTGPVFSENPNVAVLSISRKHYLRLVEWSAQQHRRKASKKTRRPVVLTRLGAQAIPWMLVVNRFEDLFRTAAGSRESCEVFYRRQNRQRLLDRRGRELLYG